MNSLKQAGPDELAAQPNDSGAPALPSCHEIRIVIWASGPITFHGDIESIRCFKEAWIREGLPLDSLIAPCG